MNFFNANIFSSKEDFLGLDLSDSSVKLFQVNRSSRGRVQGYAGWNLPPGSISDGRVVNKEAVAETLKKAFLSARPKSFTTKKVFCSIPESKAFLRIISIPKMREEEAREAVKWEIEASIPMSIDQVYFDWQFMEISSGKQNVLTVAVSKEVVDELIETVEASGLIVCGLEVESIANVRSLIPRDISPKERFLVADIGQKRTGFVIVEGNVPCFTSSVPFSSEGVTDAISKKLGTSFSEAERIKKLQGIEYSPQNSSVFEAVQSLLENLSVEIEKTVDFYQVISKNYATEIKKIIICGGGSNLKGVVPYLTTRLSKEIFFGNPWINLNLGNNIPPINKENSIRFATVIGLAIRE